METAGDMDTFSDWDALPCCEECGVVDLVESGEFDLELDLELLLDPLSDEELELDELDFLTMGNKVRPSEPNLLASGELDLVGSS